MQISWPTGSQWLVFIVLMISNPLSWAKEITMVIKYPKFEGISEERQSYRLELIKLILERTKAEYGDYRLERYIGQDPGAKRQAILVSNGDAINMVWSSPGTVIAKAGVIPIPIDILRGLLGHRVCLINHNNKLNFNAITDVNSLQSIRIGQGLGWTDIAIYNFNNITPISASTFDGLVGMLAANRFDCAPLGINEIEDIYKEKRSDMPMLSIEPSLLIYYDFPVYFYVSARYPRIAERIKKGLQTIHNSGEFDRLFDRYYHDKFKALNVKERRVICLKSPYLPEDKQCPNVNKIYIP